MLSAEYPTANIEYELTFNVPDGGNAPYRRADVAVCWPDGTIEGHEIQLSKIEQSTLSERIADYRRAGVDCVWYFGARSGRSENMRLCLDMGVDALGIDFTRSYTEMKP
jgi:hypothetical protein